MRPRRNAAASTSTSFTRRSASRRIGKALARKSGAQSGERVDAWVAAVGTGATFLGVAAFLRQRNPSILCVAVEPEGCQPLAGLPVTKPRHLVQGTSYGSVPPHWDASLMDVAVAITDGEVERWRRLLATR